MTRTYRVPGISCEQPEMIVDGDADEAAVRAAIDEAGYEVAAAQSA